MVLGTILGLPGLEHVLMQAIRQRRGRPEINQYIRMNGFMT